MATRDYQAELTQNLVNHSSGGPFQKDLIVKSTTTNSKMPGTPGIFIFSISSH